MREIKESDWKIFRQLHPVAVERYCQRALDESERLHRDANKSAHERFLAAYRLFHERNKELAEIFDNPRRSMAPLQLAAIKARGLLTEEEFTQFSEDTQRRIALLLGELLG